MYYARMVANNTNPILAIIFLILILITITKLSTPNYEYDAKSAISNDIFTLKRLRPNNSNIFFLETSCVFKRDKPSSGVILTKRQACAIYSTAILNPTRPVILYHSCPLHPDFYEMSLKYNKHVLNLPNVYIFNAKIEDILKGSIVEHITDGTLQTSLHLLEHASDILRVFFLYTYGGAYLDLDFISQKPLDTLPDNFVVAESSTLLCNGIFQFLNADHEFLQQMLYDLAYNYDPNTWSGNGPQLVTKTYKRFCNVTDDTSLTSTDVATSCGIAVCRSALFFPIHYSKWKLFFEGKLPATYNSLIEQSIAVHFWNYLSKKEAVIIGQNSSYELLACKYCKAIIHSSGETF